MRILGIDIETTGLDLDKAELAELGICLWDVERKMPLEIYSRIVRSKEKPHPVSGITVADQEEFGIDVQTAISDLARMAEKATYVVAHNANGFDIPILDRVYRECGRQDLLSLTKKIIDTRTDLPIKALSYSLQNLLIDHEIMPVLPHRAIGDVLSTMKLLARYDIQAVIARSEIPTKRLVALVGFAEKELAKERGFHWDNDRKQWYRLIKATDYDASEYPFKTQLREACLSPA